MNDTTSNDEKYFVSTRYRIVSFLLIIGILATGPAWPNGWEHHAIPLSALLRALQSEDPAYRARAALSLGIKRDPRALMDLTARLDSGETELTVRTNIYRALGRIGDPSATDTLIKALTDEEYPEARAQAALALGEIADSRALETLITALARDKDNQVRASLVSALGAFPNSQAIKALMAILETDDSALKQRAIHALGRAQSVEAVEPLLTVLAEPLEEQHRIAAIDALAMIGDPRSRAPLEALLANSESEVLRTHVVVALGAIRDGSSMPVLIELLDKGSPEQRYLVLVALTDLGDPEAVRPISGFYRYIASQIDTLSRAKPLDLIDPLVIGLRLQGASLRALLELEAGSGLDAFLHGSKHRVFPTDSAQTLQLNVLVYQARRLAISGLGYEGSQKAFDTLTSTTIWDDPDPRIRAVATRAVAVSDHPDAINYLITRLEDPYPEVRWTAASVLGRLGQSRANDPLRTLLNDSHSEVRRQAVLSLTYLNGQFALDDIRRLAQEDPSERVRNTAVKAFELMSGP